MNMLICFSTPTMIQTTIVSSRTFVRWQGHIIQVIIVKYISAGPACTDSQGILHLEGEKNCFAFAAQRTELPDDHIVKFENIHKQVEAPFTVYADFESIQKQLSGDGNTYQEHIACSYAYLIVSSVPGVEFEPWLHVGVGAADHFLETLQEDLNSWSCTSTV